MRGVKRKGLRSEGKKRPASSCAGFKQPVSLRFPASPFSLTTPLPADRFRVDMRAVREGVAGEGNRVCFTGICRDLTAELLGHGAGGA
jgi:hypothetical protein